MNFLRPLALQEKKINLMTARVSMLLKSRASLICFRVCFLPGRAKDLSAPRVCFVLFSQQAEVVVPSGIISSVSISQTECVYCTVRDEDVTQVTESMRNVSAKIHACRIIILCVYLSQPFILKILQHVRT